MTDVDATIAIPYYAQPEFLEEALASACAQSSGLREVIVVDDGSPDREARVLSERYRKNGAPVRYVRVTNRGLPNARNVGLLLATGVGFVPLDADDWLDHDFLARTLPLLGAYDAVLTGLQEHGPVRNGTYGPGFGAPIASIDEEVQWRQNHLWYCALFRRERLLEAGGWNGRMVDGFEDWDLWIDLIRRGAKIGGVDDVLFHYRTRADGMLATISDALRSEIVIEMRRHHGVNVV
jgi:glycosyltransferase involved in cell wall biosynthesis